MDIDPTTLTPEELEAARSAIVQEQRRRDELELLPRQVEALTQRFVDHGGDKSKIRDPNSYIKGPRTPQTN